MACQRLLAYPCFDALKQADPETLRQVYVRHGCRRPSLIARRLELIREAQPLSTDEALIQSAMLEAKMLATLLLHLGEAIKDYDHTLAELFPQHPDAAIFDSFPGVGTVLAPRLLAAFGTDQHRFASAMTVQNTMGISPVKKASGTTMLVHWRRACPKFLRQSFQEYANESIRQSLWAALSRAEFDQDFVEFLFFPDTGNGVLYDGVVYHFEEEIKSNGRISNILAHFDRQHILANSERAKRHYADVTRQVAFLQAQLAERSNSQSSELSGISAQLTDLQTK
jgi:hypothetical protein